MSPYRDYGGPPNGMESFFRQLDDLKRRAHSNLTRAEAQQPIRGAQPQEAPPSTKIETDEASTDQPIPREPVGPSKLTQAAFAGLGVAKPLAKTGFSEALSADRIAQAAQVNRYATPALQRLSPEFAAAAEADRAAHAATMSRYVSPALERAEGALGAGLATTAAEFLGPLALAEGVTRTIDSIPKDRAWYTPVHSGEVEFTVDGKRQDAKAFDREAEIPSATLQQDEKGLQDAYGSAEGTAYDPQTHTEYVKGSTTKRDFWDDLTKIPLGDTARSERYHQALGAYAGLVKGGKPVDRIVGHSLGGSVALTLAKNLQDLGKHVETRTFGAPVLDLVPRSMRNPKPERYRHPGDIVSMLDNGAKTTKLKLYPHTYGGF